MITFSNQYNSNKSSFEGLRQNMAIGDMALRNFKKEFPYLKSNTYLEIKIDDILQKKPPNLQRYTNINKLYERYNLGVSNLRKALKTLQYFTDKEAAFAMYKRLLKISNCGNCQECSDIIKYNLEEGGKKAVNVSMITKNKETDKINISASHVFTLIGMKDNFDITNPVTWGKSAVIVDGWKNFVIKAEDGLEYFKKLFNVDPNYERVTYQENKNLTNFE